MGRPHLSKLDQAINLAVDFHRAQVDKAGAPYILHPLRVMLSCKEEATRIAAVLHDVVEDGGCEIGLIRHKFGDDIADAVDALSRRDGESYETFIRRCALNPIAVIVKLADIEDNMDLSRLPFSEKEKGRARNRRYQAARDVLWEAQMQDDRP